MATASTVEEYVGGFPPEVRVLLLRMRETIRQVAPGGVETMAYDMPTVMVDGRPAISWSAAKKYFTLHGTSNLPPALEREVEDFRAEPDTLQFAYRKEVPWDAVADVVRHLASR
jgi:uncharacterized protein YdhG (YjbR/CyaY superfamily)